MVIPVFCAFACTDAGGRLFLSERWAWLQVHEANHHAIEFYKRFGFVQRGVDLFHAGRSSYNVLTLALTFSH